MATKAEAVRKPVARDVTEHIPSVYFPVFKESLPRMDGKTVVVTGCTSGTGWVCAKTCAELGARVIMLNRKSARADDALKELQSLVPHPQPMLLEGDLMSFASVKAAAEKLREMLAETGLDVLANNAGICALPDKATEDGVDVQIQTNHLSHFLLTSELWPLLEKASELRGEARVVNHSSVSRSGPMKKHFLEKTGGTLGGDDIITDDTSDVRNGRWHRYHQSKHAIMAFTYGLMDRTAKAGSKVKSLVAHPGICQTSMGANVLAAGNGTNTWFETCMSVSMSMEDGAMGILRCSCGDGVTSGDFYGPVNPMIGDTRGPAVLFDPEKDQAEANAEIRDLVWETSCETTGAKWPF